MGYNRFAVNDWLADVAACLEAGVPPEAVVAPRAFPRSLVPLRGYDPSAVDQLVASLDFEVQRKRPRPHLIDVKEYTALIEAERLRVAGLAGTRLLWQRRSGGGPGDVTVLDSDGHVLVARRGQQLTVAADGQVRAWRQRPEAWLVDATTWVDATSGDPAFWTIGAHQYLTAQTVVLLPGQRWLRFPVQGLEAANAVMTAVDESRAIDAQTPAAVSAEQHSSQGGSETRIVATHHPDLRGRRMPASRLPREPQ